jgi:hypothetical protein
MLLLLTRLALAADVYVSSNVKGAQILLNGAETGVLTPGTVSGVAPGVVTLTVVGDCVRGEATTAVAAGATTRISVTAVAQLGTITVRPNPSSAKLTLDDRPWPGESGAPVAVQCGAHTVAAEQSGYVPAVVTVDLQMDQDIDLPLSLSKLGMGTIDLTAQPRTATITLDGRPIGEDAVSLPSVFAGVHAIGANLDGYKTATKQIVVADGDAQAWHIELAREGSKKESAVIVIRPGRGGELAEGLDGGTEDELAAASVAEARAAGDSAARVAAEDAALQRRAEEARRRGAEDSGAAAAASRAERAEAERVAREQVERAEAERAEREAAERAEAEQAAEDQAAADRAEAEQAARAAEARRKAALAAKADVEAAEAKASQHASERAVATPAATKPAKAGLKSTQIAGVTSLVLGAGTGGLTAYFYAESSQSYRIYNAKVESARSQHDQQMAAGAQNYFENFVVPRRNALYVSGGACGALLVAGVVLVLVDDAGPVVAPLPGGGMLGWSGHF